MNNISKNQLKELVAERNTRTVLDILSSITKDANSDKYNTVIILLSRYNQYVEDTIRNITNDKTIINVIHDNIISVIDNLKGDSFAYELFTSPGRIKAQQDIEKRNETQRSVIKWVSLLSGLLLLTIGYLQFRKRLPQDPLCVVGKWSYTVTPSKGEKILGEDAISHNFVPMYDKIIGNVEIKPIVYGKSNYAMEGERKAVFIGNTEVPNSGRDLNFEEISYAKGEKDDEYSFRFGVSIIRTSNANTNQGFVRLTKFKKDDKDNIVKMRGMIYYLYNSCEVENQVWREVEIEFSRVY